MEGFNFDNILTDDEIDDIYTEENTEESTQESENNEDIETTENIQDNENSESVSSEENNIEEQEDTTSQNDGISPKNFYSSIAKAFEEEGIFPDLDKDVYSKVKTAEDFRDLVEQQIKAGLDERQKRIDEALNYGVEASDIKNYESTIKYLESIDENAISDESENGEKLRKNLIYQDFINRGFSKERATRETNKSFSAGTDIEDAKEALQSNSEFFNNEYKKLIQNAKSEVEQEEKNRKEQAEKLKTSILNDKDVFGELSVDKSTRQRVYDNLSKPIYKDPDTGEYYTALQKYEKENRTDFLKNVSLVFTLTDGFKNLDGLIKGKVKKEVKKGLKNLERTLNSTTVSSDGNLTYLTGINEDNSMKGWSLDI